MTFFVLLLIPIAIGGIAFFVFGGTITWKEFLLQLLLGVLFLVAGWQVAKWGALQDTENLNGRITSKEDGTQSCCHCHSVCDARAKDGTCTRSHDVCNHFRDYYWALQTTVGKIGIRDCSGSSSPPSIWENAQVGEPASVEHGFTNYLLADPDSLMVHGQTERFIRGVPEYPSVHSKYRINHVIGNVDAPDHMQAEMREINADLGASNQVDVTILLTSEMDPTYAQAVEAKWLYGPKNSLNIVMGIEGQTIRWVRVITFSKVEMLKVRLRDQLQGLSLDDPKVTGIIRQEVSSGFRRTSMADFEYLATTATPKGWQLALLILVQILACCGLTYWMHIKDIFGDERSARLNSMFEGSFKKNPFR